MNVLQANRLLRVADALRDAARLDWLFDMSSYGWTPDYCYCEDADGDGPQFEWVTKHNCGTPACAIGHYAVRGDLQRAFDLDKNGELIDRQTGKVTGHNTSLCRNHFGLDDEELDELFEGSGCGGADTAEEAAVYVEGFITRRGFDISEAA